MKQIILGTAGHIDHGKTSLIKAVTGIDTDRLKEEKLRGITIELGFASMDLPGGQHLGIVDVPGHEKFVKHMVAGATGIDIVVLVIAADEGVMQQTREHMEICSLLGIKHGFVALTKIDLVDQEWLELVLDDIKEFLRGTFLEDSPIMPVSSATGKGIPEFIKTLDELSALIPVRTSTGLFRLPVDRVFSMKGFGTVITGTLISGSIHIGDTVMIYPSNITSKVRGIQVHNQNLDIAEAGMRTAINFQGLEKSSVTRGEVLSTPNDLRPSFMIDVLVNYLDSNNKSAKNRTHIRFHTGTSEVLGILILLEKDELLPGETSLAQIRLDSPVALIKDDRFVIRSYSPMRTIGGGHILNPIPQKHKRFKPEVIKLLKGIVNNIPEEIISSHADDSGYAGVSFADLKIMTNLPEKQLDNTIQGLLSKKTIVCFDRENRIYIHNNGIEKLKKETLDYLSSYHKSNPLKAGMSKEELRSKLPFAVGTKLFNLILNRMIKDEVIVQEENTVRLSSHTVSLKVDQADIRTKILDAYLKSGLTPPYFKELSRLLDVDSKQAKDVLILLVDEGVLLKVKEDLYFHAEAVNELKKRVIDYLKSNEEMTTPQFKEMASVSRKYLIPLIEYFDSTKVTLRVGDSRKLRNR
ncbi:MAG: selenocysteine-specific translation elongation factor [Desulfobacterales bacterium]|uniref:Selenocysteine-specific elongation factor n=1 Tax=Candidatus Desulfaltia bathyphila TaxID=2841697 RepID=A0A8J6N3F2_9BACT|nr:selenocysteine-specific translation elongation factor [Candidatus Desulfaltia bathyphila]MBL7207080.1 selenocysteine-specific translation elongation factor [Desulfobacterales bacterium]